MQTIGFLLVDGVKYLVLVREHKTYRSFKIRITGKNGNFFSDESIYLQNNPQIVDKLINGEVISC